jgi:hypothetical protein
MPLTPTQAPGVTLAHYVQLAAHPGFKAHAWQQVNKLATDHPCLFADLPAQLTAAMPVKSSGAPARNGG